ncbi:hypothetical protein QYF61_013925 [Mycteria americana]|uniref:Uncharacterized protein n=1 Tax=Mycteria americana TaxID=33587 RepID=A0AAN7RJE4_MYCAM|nr:hypothetical protein QYF61_013925 [Mycteria americana]
MIPRTASLRQLKEVLSFFYTILMLMVNPLLYSLRNRESKVSSWDMTEPIQPQQRAFPISSADAYTDHLREITQPPEGLLKVYCQKPQPMCISRNEMPEGKGRMVANGPPLVRRHVEEEETSLQEYQVPEMRGQVWSQADIALLEEDQVREYLCKLGIQKSTGPDGIHP